jgi:homoserine kinase type II
MAVYTDLSDEDLAGLLSAYALGPALSLKGIAEGVENSNFLLDTPAGRFILTVFERRVQAEDLPFFMGVMEHLAKAGVPAPRPIRTRDGALTTHVRAKPCAIISFLNGLSPNRPSPAQCRALGASLAGLHLGLADFPLKRANALTVSAWGLLVRPRLAQAEALRPGLAQSLNEDLHALESGWPCGLPEGVIHADLFPDNVLFAGEAVGGLIDFYFACHDALAYDVAVCLNAWCFESDRSFNITKGAALLAGYRSQRALTPAELGALPMLARGAAMRFFATRLVDWSVTPSGALVRPKDPLEYADRLAFHRRAKGPADYGA